MKRINKILAATLLAFLCGLPASGQNASCSVSAYVTDKDRNGLNVRSGAGKSFGVVGKIGFSTDGIVVDVTGSSANGWVRIAKAETTEGEVSFQGEGWVFGQMLGTSTTGYDGRHLTLYKQPNTKNGIVTKVPPETQTVIVGCTGNWVKVKYKAFTGWLDENSQCGNPVTNCS